MTRRGERVRRSASFCTLHINVGTGEDLSIGDLTHMVRKAVYPEAKLVFDSSKPDGTPRKLLDVSRLHQAGWRHRVNLEDGIGSVYEWFLESNAVQRLQVTYSAGV